MIIRWMGAFRRVNYSLAQILEFEITRTDEAAAEILQEKKSCIAANVGLIIKQENVIRTFSCDVWSEYNDNGTLRPNRKTAPSPHKEAFVRMQNAVCGIAVKGLSTLPAEERRVVVRFAKRHNLQIVEIKP